jgi:hypothetical protein
VEAQKVYWNVTKELVGNDVSARLADHILDPVGWYGDQGTRDSAGSYHRHTERALEERVS